MPIKPKVPLWMSLREMSTFTPAGTLLNGSCATALEPPSVVVGAEASGAGSGSGGAGAVADWAVCSDSPLVSEADGEQPASASAIEDKTIVRIEPPSESRELMLS